MPAKTTWLWTNHCVLSETSELRHTLLGYLSCVPKPLRLAAMSTNENSQNPRGIKIKNLGQRYNGFIVHDQCLRSTLNQYHGLMPINREA